MTTDKRRPTERLGTQDGGQDEASTLAEMDEAAARHEGPAIEPSEPNGVIGSRPRRLRQTEPYMAASSPSLALKPKKSLPRRVLKWVGWTLVAVLALVVLAVGFFHTSWGKEVARGIVEGALAKRFDGEVRLGELDYALFGDLELKDLKISGHGGRQVLHLQHLQVEPDWGSLLSGPLTVDQLRVQGLALDLVAYPDGTTNLKRMQKEASKLPESVVLKAVSVKDVNVSIERGEGAERAVTRIADLALEARASLTPGAVDAEVSRLALKAGLEREGLSLSVPLVAAMKATMAGGDAKVTATVEPTEATLVRGGETRTVPVALGTLEATLAGGEVAVGLAQSTLGPLSLERVAARGQLPKDGVFAGEVLLELVGGRVDHRAVNALVGRELLVGDVGLKASVKGPPAALVVDGELATTGGALGLTGNINASDPLVPVYELTVTGADIDSARLLAGPQAQSVRSGFKAVVRGEGLPPAGKARLELDVDKTVLTQTTPEGAVVRTLDGMSLKASTGDEEIAIEGLVVRAFGQTLTFDGGFNQASREARGSLRMMSRLGEAIANAREAGVLITPLPPVEGELDVDLAVWARLKPFDVLREMAGAPVQLTELPFEALNVRGVARGTDVKVMDRQVGSLAVDVDVSTDERGPEGVEGRIAARVGGLDAGTLHLDLADLEVVLQGLTQRISLAVKDERQKLDATIAVKSELDLDKKQVKATFETVDVERGSFATRLMREVTVQLEQPAGGAQRVQVPPVVLALAGGTVSLASEVELAPDPAKPGATKVERFDVSADLDGVDVQRLAALARRSTQGLSGRFTGRLHAQGRPEDPQVDLVGSLRGRFKGGAPTTTQVDVRLRDKTLDARVAVVDGQRRVLELEAKAPITLPPPGSTQRPGLAPGGRLAVEAELHELTVAQLFALAPLPGLAALDPEAKVAGRLALSGTTARPSGAWTLSLGGDVLRRAGFERAPARQRLEIAGTMAPDGRSTRVENTLSAWLDGASKPWVLHTTRATLERSPLLRDPLGAPWTVAATLAPVDLSALSAAGLSAGPLAGQVTSEVALSGRGQDVAGTLGLAMTGVTAGAAPLTDLVSEVRVADAHIAVRNVATVAGLEALVSEVQVGVGGRGLRTALKQNRLSRAALSGEVRLPEHTLAQWRRALGEPGRRLAELPGKLGGVVTLSGTVASPEAEGAFAWDGFETASGRPGRVGVTVAVTAQELGGGLELGAGRDVAMKAAVSRDALTRLAPTAPLPVALTMRAVGVDLRDLVPAPAGASKVKPLELQGTLDWDMRGQLLVERDPAKKASAPLAPGSGLDGHLRLGNLDVAVPDTDRHFRDGEVKLVATREALRLERLFLREADVQREDRTVTVTAEVPWTDLKPSAVKARAKTHEWLVLGLGFDGPEGELDLDLALDVRGLDEPVKQVEVTVHALELYAPDRFVRAHYPQFPAYDDLIFVSGDQPSGRLPKKAPLAIALPGAGGVDVKLRIPEPIHVIMAAASPIELKLKGEMDVVMRGVEAETPGLTLKGRLDVTDGVLDAMGRPFELVTGAITADGGLETALAEMVFATRPNDLALRDVALGEHNEVATITVRASATHGLQTIFGGVSGPYLLDMATFLNTGRGRLWGQPDAPTSEVVRFGGPEQGLVNSFVQTNLRNLVFMDRAHGWSTSQADPSQYGRLRHFDMQRFLPAEDRTRRPGQRLRFTAQPLEPGVGPFTLGYDWLLVSEPRTVFGFGPFVDFDLRAGVGFSLDWSSER